MASCRMPGRHVGDSFMLIKNAQKTAFQVFIEIQGNEI